jgi:hypothetical protein
MTPSPWPRVVGFSRVNVISAFFLLPRHFGFAPEVVNAINQLVLACMIRDLDENDKSGNLFGCLV